MRSLRPDEPKKSPGLPPSPQTPTAKNSSKRGKDSPRTPPVPVCLTVQNLPLDHASLVKVAYEDPVLTPTTQKGRARGRPRTLSQSASGPHLHPALEEEEDEEELEQRLKLREQLGVSSLLQLASAPKPDLSVLADVALKMDPEADIDSEETETSDEAEEHKLEEEEGDFFAPHPRQPLPDPEGLFVLQEHNYSKTPAPPHLTSPQKRTKQDPTVLLPADLNQHGVQEAPEEVIGDALAARGEAPELYGDLSGMGLLCDARDTAETQTKTLGPPHKRRGSISKEMEMEERGKGKSKKRSRKDKENEELQISKKQKEKQIKKQRKRKLEVCAFVWFSLNNLLQENSLLSIN